MRHDKDWCSVVYVYVFLVAPSRRAMIAHIVLVVTPKVGDFLLARFL